jgi:hypothetical protein
MVLPVAVAASGALAQGAAATVPSALGHARRSSPGATTHRKHEKCTRASEYKKHKKCTRQTMSKHRSSTRIGAPRSTSPATVSSPVTSTPSTPSCPSYPPPLPSLPGPTSLTGGIFDDATGGGLPQAGCPSPPDPTPIGGTVTIEDEAGKAVATQFLAAGQTFDITVSPGAYTIVGKEDTVSGGETGCEGGPVTVTAGQQTPIYCWLIFP